MHAACGILFSGISSVMRMGHVAVFLALLWAWDSMTLEHGPEPATLEEQMVA